MEILVLEHEAEVPAALFADWARERGHALHTLAVPELERWPDPRAFDVVVSLGSDASVHASPERWIAREVEFLRDAHDASVHVLGICFGAQALAKALGGEVSRARRIQLEWTTIETRDRELIPPGPWLRWHEDVFTLPPGARQLASAGDVPMAFALERSVGVQFHPEADAEIARGWIAAWRRTPGASRAAGLAALEGALEGEREDARRRAFDLFDRIAGRSRPARRAPSPHPVRSRIPGRRR